MKLAVDVVLHQQQSLLGHFLAVAVDQLDAVIVVGVVAGGDHDAAVEVIHAGNVSHGRRGGNMEQVSICSGGSQASNQAVLKHIRATASILTNDDTSRVDVTVALTQNVIIPS